MRRLLVFTLQFFLLSASAQVDTAEIKQLEKEMYRFFSSSESDSFMLVTERLKEACERAGASQERLFYKAWANQAIYYFTRVNRSRGLEMAQQIRDQAYQHDSKFGLYTSTYAMATMQVNLRRFDQAEKSFLESIDYQHRFFPDESAAAPYLGMAKIYVNTRQHEKVIECARKALAEPGVIKQHQLTAWSYICIAYSDDRYTTKDFNEAYAEREKVKQDYGHDDMFGETVELYYHRKNGRLREALEIAKNFKAKSDRLNMMSALYAQMGDYKEAYLWHKRYKEYQDSVNSAEVQQLSYEYASQLDVSRAENEAKDLRISNQMLEMRAGIIILLISLAFLIFYLYRRRIRLNELRKAYDQLEDTTTAKERIDSELRIARDIQMGMVPTKFPAFPDRNDIDLYAFMRPAKEVGGDLYDFFLQGDRFYFCVGDVSGKGVPASMTMAVVVNLFRTVAKEGFPPEYVATKLNDTLSEDNESSMFVTMFIGMIDLKTGRLDFCNCGHNPPILGQHRAHTSQTVFRYIDMEPNAPIGLWPGMEFVGEHIDGVHDHSLFVYTDGVSEAENIDQDQFGEKRMLRVLNESSQPFGERLPKSRSHYLVDRMKTAVEQFTDGAEQSDDLTMFCVQIK
ncbi:MAG: SpoIIE family protein phosphatase [Prevotella sp.]|nr:SpoIIE family protein phosphatase [Prevotella sp.]